MSKKKKALKADKAFHPVTGCKFAQKRSYELIRECE